MAGRLLFVTLMYSCANTKTQARPQLIMNSAVISETETVTLDCRAPSYPTVHQCYFTIIGAKHAKGFTCVQTLTGTELLRMSDQRAPAEVKVDCYYTVMVGDVNHPSAHSVTSSITIQNVVKSSTTQTKTASAVTTAGLCASRPVTTVKQTSAGLSASRPVTRIKQTPDQTFGPRNSGSFSSPPLTTDKPTSDVVESSTTQTKPASTVTTAGLSASTPVTRIKQTSADQTFGPRNSGSFSSPPLTTDKPTSEMQRWMFMVIAICLGGFFSISLLGLGLLCSKRTLERCSYKRSQADVTGSVKLEEQTFTNENPIYHLYSTIPDEPPASAQEEAMYSYLQPQLKH
uniref:uncharacterized protein LOC120835183 isoform X5 n=1 Tax=Gasterosteus aculeatus aculeatus TaxID=481459 RepID=UPI001A992272|nr:uncharacterized protein LOC120835183 isoform X5 [Gasterosteus aculeatus aculeatus]